jgi:hypothetical protein
MRSKNLFVKRVPLSRRLLFWGSPVLLLFILWPSEEKPNMAYGNFWAAPIEPPGAIWVTPNTQAKPLADTPSSLVVKVSEAPAATVPKPAASDVSAEPVAPVVTTEVTRQAALLLALEQWRSAWETQNLPLYLASYGANFETPQNQSRQAWANARTARIKSKQKISLTLKDLNVQLQDRMAVVTFTQLYVDERLRLTDRKTLVWQEMAGRWVIQRETTE